MYFNSIKVQLEPALGSGAGAATFQFHKGTIRTPALVGSAACQFFCVSQLSAFVGNLCEIVRHTQRSIDVEMLCPSVDDWKVGVCPAACIRHYLY